MTYPFLGVSTRLDRPSSLGAAVLDFSFAQRPWSRWLAGSTQKRKLAGFGMPRHTPHGTLRMRGRVAAARGFEDGITTGAAAARLGVTVRRACALMRMAGFRGTVLSRGRGGRTTAWSRR